MHNQNTILLYSCGSPIVVDYEEVCFQNRIDIIGVVNNLTDQKSFASDQLNYLTKEDLTDAQEYRFICPLFTSYNRFRAVEEALGFGLKPIDLLSDRRNILPSNFIHGVGCFINAGVVIGSSSRIGHYVVINRGACLGHDFIAEDYASIGPGVTTGGSVRVGRGAVIGTGAVILPEIHIGKHSIIGAGAVVTKNVADHNVVVGNPAQVIKINTTTF